MYVLIAILGIIMTYSFFYKSKKKEDNDNIENDLNLEIEIETEESNKKYNNIEEILEKKQYVIEKLDKNNNLSFSEILEIGKEYNNNYELIKTLKIYNDSKSIDENEKRKKSFYDLTKEELNF